MMNEGKRKMDEDRVIGQVGERHDEAKGHGERLDGQENLQGGNGQGERMRFEDIFKQNERRIHYHIHKLNIQDPHNEFYVEGLHAMWSAYKKYRPDQGVMSTYFNFIIRNRLIDMMRKRNREKRHTSTYVEHEKQKLVNGNRDCKTNLPILETNGIELEDETFWKDVRAMLTDNQWKWVKYYIIEEMSLKEIAEQEGVTVEAVKSWRKTAKKRLEHAGIHELLE